MIASVLFAVAYYGLNFDPAVTNVATEARIYPISPIAYRMVQPDGQARIFELTDPENGVLTGPEPWLGVIKDRRIDVWADPKYTGGKLRTAYTFVSGRLRLMVLDGEKFTFAKGVGGHGGLDELFPPQKKRSYAKHSAADIWDDAEGGRFRLWFANPNSAGILLAMLSLLLVWALTRGGKRVRAAAGLLLPVTLYGLFATGSRGALLGFTAGALVVLLPFARLAFTRRGLLVILSGVLLLCAAMVATGNTRRVADSFLHIDRGNSLRLKIGKAAVQMFADAPTGWSGGEVPGRNACLNWYVFDEMHILRTHLVSLAECGWFCGFAYAAFWLLMVVIGLFCFRKGNPLIAALWTAFGAAGCFNPVYTEWEIWVLPVSVLALLSVPRYRLTVGEWKACAVLTAVSAVAVISVLVLIGKVLERPVRTEIRSCGPATFVNGDSPRLWIAGDPLVMAGNGFPGREILAYYARHRDAGAVAYVYAVEDLPSEAEYVVIAGRCVPEYFESYMEGRHCKAKHLMLLSPSVGPDRMPNGLADECDVVWVAGTLLACRDDAYAEKREWVKLVPGCERYIPNWLEFYNAYVGGSEKE